MVGVQGSIEFCNERYLCSLNELSNKPNIERKQWYDKCLMVKDT